MNLHWRTKRVLVQRQSALKYPERFKVTTVNLFCFLYQHFKHNFLSRKQPNLLRSNVRIQRGQWQRNMPVHAEPTGRQHPFQMFRVRKRFMQRNKFTACQSHCTRRQNTLNFVYKKIILN